MGTVSRQSVETIVNERLTDSRWRDVLFDIMLKLNKDFYPAWETDAVCQKFMGPFDIYDAYCFANIHSMIYSGEIGVVQIEVGAGPFPDKCVSQNNDLLKKLPPQFEAEFIGKLYDDDGELRWNKPIVIDVLDPSNEQEILIPPNAAPLEVGYTHADRSFLHLQAERRLARWPYGHKYITLLWHIDPGPPLHVEWPLPRPPVCDTMVLRRKAR